MGDLILWPIFDQVGAVGILERRVGDWVVGDELATWHVSPPSQVTPAIMPKSIPPAARAQGIGLDEKAVGIDGMVAQGHFFVVLPPACFVLALRFRSFLAATATSRAAARGNANTTTIAPARRATTGRRTMANAFPLRIGPSFGIELIDRDVVELIDACGRVAGLFVVQDCGCPRQLRVLVEIAPKLDHQVDVEAHVALRDDSIRGRPLDAVLNRLAQRLFIQPLKLLRKIPPRCARINFSKSLSASRVNASI